MVGLSGVDPPSSCVRSGPSRMAALAQLQCSQPLEIFFLSLFRPFTPRVGPLSTVLISG